MVADWNLDQLFKEIRQWLKPIDPYLNHNAACGKRQEGTGNWFLEGDQFREWQNSPNSFLWLHGKRLSPYSFHTPSLLLTGFVAKLDAGKRLYRKQKALLASFRPPILRFYV